jgi:hypothetical protein
MSEKPKKNKLYVKFSNNIHFSESFLKKYNIEYEPEDLEDTPLGKCYVVRRDSNGQNIDSVPKLQ